MVTDYEHLSELFDGSELVLGVELRLKEVTHTHKSLKAEVHFWHFVLLVVNYLVVGVNFWIEVSGKEAITDIIQKLLLPT